MTTAPAPLDFLAKLNWLDGRPLLDTIEEYRRRLLTTALYTFDDRGMPRYNLVLDGRAKKNNKTTDLCLASFYRLLAWPADKGADVFLLANDEAQAADDLDLCKKLVAANPLLAAELDVQAKQLVRLDDRGALKILAAGDAVGAHGKTFSMVGFDEIHGYSDWSTIEALQPDPTRPDALTWITSYDSLLHVRGRPLHDLMQRGKAGDDPRMLFSWYSGSYGTDENFAQLETPELRANPSMASWPDGDKYLAQQRARLPTHLFRRLHLNEGGQPAGARFDAEMILGNVVEGRRTLPPQTGVRYFAYVDMSGGSNDDACLAVAHAENGVVVVDLVAKQDGRPPFDPRAAVDKFARILAEYGVREVHGDAYGGETFGRAFGDRDIYYCKGTLSASQLYDQFEVALNTAAVELVDLSELTEQLLGLVWRGGKTTHLAGSHDDHANVAAGVTHVVRTSGAAIDLAEGTAFYGMSAVLEEFGWPERDPWAPENPGRPVVVR